jgi:hypothetical protein
VTQVATTPASLEPTRRPPGTPTPTTGPTPSPSTTPSTTPTTPPSADCAERGTTISLGAVARLDAACIGAEFRVAGWWDLVHSDDGDAATLFWAVLRDRLPGTRAAHRDGAWVAVQTEEDGESADLHVDLLIGEWVTARVRLEQDERCRWVFAEGGEWEPEPPAWTCPRHLQVLSATAADPPAGQLDACPDTDRPIRVERFVETPRACFGTRSVQLRGWLDTAYIISGSIDPWTPEPAWLWSDPIGRVTMLSPTSSPSGPGALLLRVEPGSAVQQAARNRWVVATGHYARKAEWSTCRARSLIDGVARPSGAPTRAEARATCARSFVLESVRPGSPG